MKVRPLATRVLLTVAVGLCVLLPGTIAVVWARGHFGLGRDVAVTLDLLVLVFAVAIAGAVVRARE